MAESAPTPPSQEPERDSSAPGRPQPAEPQPPAPPPAPRRRRRRWPWVIGGIIVLLIVVAALAPTIASMGWARSLIVSQIDQRLNGHIEIKDWSLGWSHGLRFDGLVVYDESNRQIMQLPHLSTQLTLASLLHGNYDAGKVEVDGLDVLIVREPDGSLNWDHIVKSSGKPSAPGSANKSSKAPSKLPNVRAELALNSADITYEDRQQNQTLHLRSVNANVNVPDINKPITDTLAAQAQLNDEPPGTIALSGSLDLVKNNQVAINSGSLDQTLKLQNVDLKAVSALMGDRVKLKLLGNTDAQVVVQLKNGTDGSVQASLASRGFGASGESLGGGVLRSDALTFNLPRTTIHAAHGIGDLKSLQVSVGRGGAEGLAMQLKNASLVSGQGAAARQALKDYTLDFATALTYATGEQGSSLAVNAFNLKDNQNLVSLVKRAGQNLVVLLPAKGDAQASGAIQVAADWARINRIVRALSGRELVAKDQNGAELRSGKLAGEISLAQAGPRQIQITSNLGITDITVASGSATPIQNEKIQLTGRMLASPDLSQLDVPQFDVAGDILRLHAQDTVLKLSNGPGGGPVPLFERIQKISARVEAPSLAKLQALVRAWSPAPRTVALRTTAGPVPGSEMAQAGRAPAPGALAAGSAAPTSQPAELPPADITSGSAVLTLDGGYEAGKLHLVPGAVVSNFAFRRGAIARNVGNIDLKSDATITPAQAGSNATVIEQIGQLQVAKLDVNAPQINSSVSLVRPIVLNNPADLMQLLTAASPGAQQGPPASMTGRILLRGDPDPILAIKDAWNGQTSEHRYGGGYAIDEQFTTEPSGQIAAVGRADLNDFTIDGQPYPEKALRVLSDLALNARQQTLGINNLSVLSTTTHGVDLQLKGRLLDLATLRRIDNVMTADLAYDGAMLWKMILPLLPEEKQQSLAGTIVAGKYHKQFEIRGSYPANKPFNQAIRSLSAAGDVTLDRFAVSGADLRKLELPLDLHDGVLTIAYAGKPTGQNVPAPASLNGGTIALGGVLADLRQPHIRITTPGNLKFIDHVSLNPVFASTFLGEYLNNPVFVGANQASGILNVTIDQCEGLALDDALKTAQSGKAVLDLSLSEVHVGNELIARILSLAGQSGLIHSFEGDVKSYHVVIDRGVLNQNMTLTLAQSDRPLKVFGDVRLADDQMMPVTIDMPWALFAVGKNSELKKYLPQGIQIPLRGTPGSPSFGVDINQIVQQAFVQAGQKALQDKLLKGITGQKGGSTTQPADQNPIQQLQDLFNQGKKDKKKQ